MFPALVIEGLALAMIVFLFFNMRADMNRQSQLKMMAEGTTNTILEPARGNQRFTRVVQSVIDRAPQQWKKGWDEFGSAN